MKVAADFRREAREALGGKWLPAVLTGLVASLLGATGSEGIDINFERSVDAARIDIDLGGFSVYSAGIDYADSAAIQTFLTGTALYVFLIALIAAVLFFILGCIVTIGYAKYNMELVEGKEVSMGRLFDYFPQWKTMVKAGLLQAVFVFLWMLLFIIPGIVAAYRYAMTSYILAENPEMGAMEAIDRSKEMMNGNKYRLFCLNFSFIGWSILCIFTLGIGNLFLLPYEQAATAAFYRDLTTPLAGKEDSIYLQETNLSE